MTGEVLHHRGVSNPSACSGDRQGQLCVSHQRRLVGRAVIPARLLELRTTDQAIGTDNRQLEPMYNLKRAINVLGVQKMMALMG